MIRTSLLCLCVMTAPAVAADFSDPTWPCVQRKVGELSLGLMWPFPVEEGAVTDPDTKSQIDELAGLLALRRVELSELEPEVSAFAETVNGDAQTLGHVFAQVFKGLSNRRTRIMSGIEKFSLSQIALAEQIDRQRVEMATALEADDFDTVDALEEKTDWDQLIYTDRQQSIVYLCETPQLLERRIFAIAQMLQMNIREDG